MNPTPAEHEAASGWVRGLVSAEAIPCSFWYDGREHTQTPTGWSPLYTAGSLTDGRTEHTLSPRPRHRARGEVDRHGVHGFPGCGVGQHPDQ